MPHTVHHSGLPRVLFVSYAFPPVGGAGVQRTTKFTKYLSRHGWLPSVLTVANPSVPVLDESLAADIPCHTIVCRAKTWEPGYAFKMAVLQEGTKKNQGAARFRRVAKNFLRRITNLVLQPDPQILWMPQAVREGHKLLREVPHKAIVATGPPFSTFLIGAALSRRTGLPLVLDYRDEWDLSSSYWENRRRDSFSRCIQNHMQKRVMRSAKALIATTRSSALALGQVRARVGSKARLSWIYNGFDPEDFPVKAADASSGKGPYRLAYVGTLWNLTSAAPLVEAVQLLGRRWPDLAKDLELVFAGRRTPSQQDVLAPLKDSPSRLVEHPYLEHRRALDMLRTSSGLCVLLADLPGAGRVVPAKIFEYMAAKRPILVIAPRGELWDLLEAYPAGNVFAPNDVEGVASFLAKEIQRHQEGRLLNYETWNGSQFDRCSQAGQLAAILQSLLSP